ncbi:flagellar motor switch protein FliG [Rhodovulum sp. ES.010]|uniref:flagellar motor switch protein FliG n=1 Tax=Rhodovulum sp. ES.010 TaxID=1882821 RepID=UPI00092A954D|nr:FliG C-terminal domain-containing protein [Rhodovulum sp. ES.010]SIO25035.1 flagellar motor switch protein FliG [Rhodovulum sp. ES.010]
MNSLAPTAPQGYIRAPATLSQRRKAAIIVRLMLSEGVTLPLSDLPPALQANLADELANLRYIDAPTLQAVVTEFLAELEQAGLAFPGGVDGALELLGEHLSPEATAAIQAKTTGDVLPESWVLLADQEPGKLAGLLQAEAPEVAAVVLAKLPSLVAAQTLGKMAGPQARRIAFAITRTSQVPPAAVNRIGDALARRILDTPAPAFEAPPEKRVGAILDAAPATTRDDVLEGLAETDAELAERVRRAVFTFADIPERLEPLDIQALTRTIEQDVLVTALAGADDKNQAAADFILSNMSQRLAGQLRDEISERETPEPEAVETAMAEITAALRGLEAAGEIKLKAGKK